MKPRIPLLMVSILAGCAGVGTEANFPDMPDAVPSGPGAMSGEQGEFVLYSTTGSDSGKRKAAAIGDAQSKYGAVVRPDTEQAPTEEPESTEKKAQSE